jgi:hypothetical protein
MSEPAAVGRRALAWWPAIVALADEALKPVTDAARPVLSVLGYGLAARGGDEFLASQ